MTKRKTSFPRKGATVSSTSLCGMFRGPQPDAWASCLHKNRQPSRPAARRGGRREAFMGSRMKTGEETYRKRLAGWGRTVSLVWVRRGAEAVWELADRTDTDHQLQVLGNCGFKQNNVHGNQLYPRLTDRNESIVPTAYFWSQKHQQPSKWSKPKPS